MEVFMENIIVFLDQYAFIALVISAVGIIYKVALHFIRLVTHPPILKPYRNIAVDGIKPRGIWESIFKFFATPTKRASKGNPIFALGAVMYHIGIITVSTGYAISLLILLYHIMNGNPIPDISNGSPQSYNYSLSNIFAIIFGNGEWLQAKFLFGSFAEFFVYFTWIIVISAFIGNSLLMIVHIFGLSGAIIKDIDPAATGVRRKGRFKFSHLLFTTLVYAIIWTEILARLEIFHGMVYIHSILGATMIMIFPYSYLFHMFYAPVAVYYGARRWRYRYIA
jgi:nitrate reductase gamma subunit